jgi:hypothetical protein
MPKLSTLMDFSIINQPFWDPPFMETSKSDIHLGSMILGPYLETLLGCAFQKLY